MDRSERIGNNAQGLRRNLRLLVPVAWLLVAAGCAVDTIAHQQEEPDANHIVHLLGLEGIDAEKLRDEESRDLRFNVTVMKEDRLRALAILNRENLPMRRQVTTEDMFKESGMIPTSTQEEARRVVGIEGDIINDLRKINRVVKASCKVSIPKDDPLRDVNEERPQPKASVLIHYLPDAQGRPPITIEGVQKYVAAAHAELRAAEVSVQMIPTVEAGAQEQPQDPGAQAPAFANGCERERVIGIDVCKEHKKKLLNSLWGAVLLAFVLSGMVVISVFRALRYRRDLTRLTAQVQQLRK